MYMKNLIFDLCNATGISGDEKAIADVCIEKLAPFAEVSTDKNSNVIAVLGNKEADKTILLDAHMDRIGFIVTQIDSNGFVKVDSCGGIDIRTLADTAVITSGKDRITGVVCCNPPHLSDGNEDKAVSMDKVWIDFGMPYDEVIKKVKIGDSLTFLNNPIERLRHSITDAV